MKYALLISFVAVQALEDLESAQEQGLQADSAREYATHEELIAFDRTRTPVPEALHPRVSEAVRNSAPEAPKPWWKRLV